MTNEIGNGWSLALERDGRVETAQHVLHPHGQSWSGRGQAKLIVRQVAEFGQAQPGELAVAAIVVQAPLDGGANGIGLPDSVTGPLEIGVVERGGEADQRVDGEASLAETLSQSAKQASISAFSWVLLVAAIGVGVSGLVAWRFPGPGLSDDDRVDVELDPTWL